jgi:hypothetical protein
MMEIIEYVLNSITINNPIFKAITTILLQSKAQKCPTNIEIQLSNYYFNMNL